MTYLDRTDMRLQILNAPPIRSELPDGARERWPIGDTDMASFTFLGKTLDLPAVKMPTNVATREPTAWQSGNFVTVRLTHPISALRVHPNNLSFPGQHVSPDRGTWVFIGDAIQASSSWPGSRSLSAQTPRNTLAFTRTSEAHLAADTVLNVGLASAKFGGSGDGLQAEYVSGPPMQFTLIADKYWHGGSAHA